MLLSSEDEFTVKFRLSYNIHVLMLISILIKWKYMYNKMEMTMLMKKYDND